MDTTNIICTSCGAAVPLSDALTHKLREEMKGEFEREMKLREEKLREKEKLMMDEKKKMEDEYQARIDSEKKKMWVMALEKAKEKNDLEMKDLKESFEEQRKKIEEMREQELKLRKQTRELEEKEKEMKLEMERKLDVERKVIAEQTQKKVSEEMSMKLAEKEKQMDQMKRTIEELKRKSEQGSMQIQGDAQENNLKLLLQQSFPMDTIADVPTGIKGADLVQTVLSSTGQKSGVILWESKNTKAWKQEWLQKLKDDQIAIKADLSILVSQVLPEGVDQFAQIEGIWVVHPSSAVHLVQALRYHIIEVGQLKTSLVGKGEKMELLYQYLSGPEFRARVENIVSAFTHLQQDLDSERRAMERIWNKRQKELERVITNTSGMYGDLQGIAGSGLARISALEMPGMEDEEES